MGLRPVWLRRLLQLLGQRRLPSLRFPTIRGAG